MKRHHLLEIHEQPWCPRVVREGALDCLRVVATIGMQYRNVVPLLQAAIEQTGTDQVIDLCSGSGGPWLSIHCQLHAVDGKPLRVALTDLYPDKAGFARTGTKSDHAVFGYTHPVDATEVGNDLPGMRTLFTAFHHFRPDKARALLQNAVDDQQPIAIFEQTQRSSGAILFMLVLPWLALLIIPFLRPFSAKRLLFTYLVPAIPLILCVDGVVSCLRTYSPEELKMLSASLSPNTHSWQIGRVGSPLSPIPISYLIGLPTGTDS